MQNYLTDFCHEYKVDAFSKYMNKSINLRSISEESGHYLSYSYSCYAYCKDYVVDLVVLKRNKRMKIPKLEF